MGSYDNIHVKSKSGTVFSIVNIQHNPNDPLTTKSVFAFNFCWLFRYTRFQYVQMYESSHEW